MQDKFLMQTISTMRKAWINDHPDSKITNITHPDTKINTKVNLYEQNSTKKAQTLCSYAYFGSKNESQSKPPPQKHESYKEKVKITQKL